MPLGLFPITLNGWSCTSFAGEWGHGALHTAMPEVEQTYLAQINEFKITKSDSSQKFEIRKPRACSSN